LLGVAQSSRWWEITKFSPLALAQAGSAAVVRAFNRAEASRTA
jgi:hypothetical protein